MRDSLGIGMETNDRSDLIRRPRLEQRLAKAHSRRVVSLIAGAGFGKTTAMTQAFDSARTVWHTVTAADRSVSTLARSVIEKLRLMVPEISGVVLMAVAGGSGPHAKEETSRPEALAAAIAQEVAAHTRRAIVVVLDDVQELAPGSESSKFLAALCRQAPDNLQLVFASRVELPFPTARMQVASSADEVGAEDLAFTVEEVEELARVRVPGMSRRWLREIHERTAGWPVAVVYALEAARRAGHVDVDEALRGETLFRYLAEEVLGARPDELTITLRSVAELPWIDPELLAHLEDRVAGIRVLDQPLPHLLSRVPELPNARAVAPLVKDYLVERFALPPAQRGSVLEGAADWYESGGFLTEALACRSAVGDRDVLSRFLSARGPDMISLGMAEQVAAVLELLGDAAEPDVILLGAEAHQVLGNWEEAMSRYRRLVPQRGDIPARIAWRLGFLHHMRGDVTSALEVYELGVIDADEPVDSATLCAWRASAHWLRGERAAAERLAAEALSLAQESNAAQALATAHTVLAMVAALDGDRAANDMHYLRALEHAERARDVIQTIRIRSNRSSHFLEEGDYESAQAELEIALRLADMSGFELWRAMALANRGQVFSMLGSLDEAISDLTQAREVFRRIGSNFEAYPLAHLGDVYALRGDSALARTCYEESIAMADRQSDLQALVPALSGLARLIASDDPDQARALAKRATEVDSVIGRVRALVTSGWVELESGDIGAAAVFGNSGADVARVRHDLPGLADALELLARCRVGEERVHLLEQAREVWQEVEAPVGVARVDLALASESLGPDSMGRALSAAATLSRLGAKGLALQARSLADRLARPVDGEVSISTLGRFEVAVDGAPVPRSAWQSKVARDLLGMLVAARGRPIHREVLIDRLWPGDDTSKAGNRLSVALTTIRNVLDPEKRFDASRFVVADRDSVGLALDPLHIDVHDFLDVASKGLRSISAGDAVTGRAFLQSAEAMYLGDFLEEHPYEDWTMTLREEAKSVYVNLATVLAEADIKSGDYDSAVRRFLRILERDPYNEPAHLSLVEAMARSGRYGAARRLYGIYVSRMSELDVEPEAFPG